MWVYSHPNQTAIRCSPIFGRVTIRCPYCEGLIPLSPNWRLSSDGVGVKIVPQLGSGPEDSARRCEFEIVRAIEEHSAGTVADGDGTCPLPDCGRVISGDDIKRQAQAGHMGEQLFAMVVKTRIQTRTKAGSRGRDKWEHDYRSPRPDDDVGTEVARRLSNKLDEWAALDIIPNEEIPVGLKTTEPHRYGMLRWRDLFNARQLLCHGTAVETFRELVNERNASRALTEIDKAAFVYIALALDKMNDYNSRGSRWEVVKGAIGNTFARHDLSIKWSYAEMAPVITSSGYEWVVGQIGKCIGELCQLVLSRGGRAQKFV